MAINPTDELKPIIVLAAHGERGGAGDDARLAGMAAEVGAAIPGVETCIVRVNDQAEAAERFARIGERRVVVVPLLFSDGFFMRERLKPLVQRARHKLLAPLVFWPEFGAFLEERIADGAPQDVFVVAHGSGRSSASAEAAERVAGALRGRFGSVRTAFLEQEPFAADVLAEAGERAAVVGLFFGAGMHGAEDFSRLIREMPVSPALQFTVGEMAGLSELVAQKAQAALAELEAG